MNTKPEEKTTVFQEFKNKIKDQWSKLTDSHIDEAQGDEKRLTSSLRDAYGYSDEQAFTEFSKFREAHPRDFAEWSENAAHQERFARTYGEAPITPRKDDVLKEL